VLLADEARHNLPLGLLATISSHPEIYPERRFWLVEENDVVVGAALRTPPFNLLLARPLDDRVLDALAASIEDELPGVTAALPEAEAFAAIWCRATGLQPRVAVAQGIYRLERLLPVSGVSGSLRKATTADRVLVGNWFRAFSAEAHPQPADADADARLERALDARMGHEGNSGVVLWEDSGEIVSLAAFGGETPRGIRIGPVFTPPEYRRRGYASALTAALSAQLLASGRRFCFLYTDLANPTANRIYRAIGYEHVCDSAEIAFERS
jgi:predicted GNAT family acetyltransferase